MNCKKYQFNISIQHLGSKLSFNNYSTYSRLLEPEQNTFLHY